MSTAPEITALRATVVELLQAVDRLAVDDGTTWQKRWRPARKLGREVDRQLSLLTYGPTTVSDRCPDCGDLWVVHVRQGQPIPDDPTVTSPEDRCYRRDERGLMICSCHAQRPT